jgi:colicin import membrane protein
MHSAGHHSLLVSRRAPVGRFLVLSLGGHAAVLVAVFVYNAYFAAPPLVVQPTPIRATLVRQGKPRDEKLLPRKEQPPPPPPQKVDAAPSSTPPPPAPPTVAVPVPGLKPEPAPKPTPSPGEKQGEKRRDRLFGAFDKFAKPTKPDEDPEGAADGDPNGDAAKAEGERYFGLLSSQVRRHYNVADTIPEKERLYLKAQVALRLSRTGEVIEARLAKASGNSLFDSAVLSAVTQASPFSPPPDHLRDTLQKSGIVLEFSP